MLKSSRVRVITGSGAVSGLCSLVLVGCNRDEEILYSRKQPWNLPWLARVVRAYSRKQQATGGPTGPWSPRVWAEKEEKAPMKLISNAVSMLLHCSLALICLLYSICDFIAPRGHFGSSVCWGLLSIMSLIRLTRLVRRARSVAQADTDTLGAVLEAMPRDQLQRLYWTAADIDERQCG